MPRSNSDRRPRRLTLERVTVIAFGLYLAGVGIDALTLGDWMYPNYLRWPVAAPVALAIGVVMMIAGIAMDC